MLTRRAPESIAIGWTVNRKSAERPLLYYSGPGHLLTIAPTPSGKGAGLATHAQTRRLMKPEQNLDMMDGMALLFVKGFPPMKAGKIRCFERPEF